MREWGWEVEVEVEVEEECLRADVVVGVGVVVVEEVVDDVDLSRRWKGWKGMRGIVMLGREGVGVAATAVLACLESALPPPPPFSAVLFGAALAVVGDTSWLWLGLWPRLKPWLLLRGCMKLNATGLSPSPSSNGLVWWICGIAVRAARRCCRLERPGCCWSLSQSNQIFRRWPRLGRSRWRAKSLAPVGRCRAWP